MEYAGPGQGPRGLLGRLTRTAGGTRRQKARTAFELATKHVITAGPDASVRELIHLMQGHDINRIPIVEAGSAIGIVTRADVLRMMARPDAAITEEVRWRVLHDLWIDTDELKISTHDGIVKIEGEVATHSDATLMERWAAATEGVVAVDTQGLRYRLDDRRIAVTTDRLR